MNLERRLLQSLIDAKAPALQLSCLAAHAASQLCPGPPVSRLTPAGSGGAGGTGTRGRPSLEKQCLRSRMNAFSCCVLRAVVRHAARQYWNGVLQRPVSGLRAGGCIQNVGVRIGVRCGGGQLS